MKWKNESSEFPYVNHGMSSYWFITVFYFSYAVVHSPKTNKYENFALQKY
jgi:hypothetical protein